MSETPTFAAASLVRAMGAGMISVSTCSSRVRRVCALAAAEGRGMKGKAIGLGTTISLAGALFLFVAASHANAQSTGKVYRIGWLSHGSSPSGPSRSVGDFQLGLIDLGYVVGRNLAIEYRYADGNLDRLADLAAQLVRVPVDVIVTSGEPAAVAAKRATKTIPIVVTDIGDPVKAGLVASLGRPEANITGMATLSEELWQKRLALLKEVAPRLSRPAVLWNPANPGNASCVEEIKAAAPGLGLQVRSFEVRDTGSFERAFASIASGDGDSLVTCWDSVTLAHARRIADFALKHHLPLLAPLREYVEAGGLLSLGTSLPAQRRRTAYYVDKILKGAKPADLPVEQPMQFELVLNLATAKTLEIAFPGGLLLLADEAIQ